LALAVCQVEGRHPNEAGAWGRPRSARAERRPGRAPNLHAPHRGRHALLRVRRPVVGWPRRNGDHPGQWWPRRDSPTAADLSEAAPALTPFTCLASPLFPRLQFPSCQSPPAL